MAFIEMITTKKYLLTLTKEEVDALRLKSQPLYRKALEEIIENGLLNKNKRKEDENNSKV